MEHIRIDVAENGFVVCEEKNHATMGRQWAFETAASLAVFIEKWGKEQAEKPRPSA